MNILVTGCAGFIGSHVTERLLLENNVVIGIDNFNNFYSVEVKEKNLMRSQLFQKFILYKIDIKDTAIVENIFEKHNIDVVIHLAAKAGVRPSIEDPKGYYLTNLLGTLNILEAMKKNDIVKLIFASSSSVYGNNSKIPFKESDNVDHPISPYAGSKKATELLIYTYYKLYGIQSTLLRFFTVYGPRQRPEMAIAKFTRMILENREIELYAGGKSFRDYTYIDDIVDGIICAIEKIKGFEIINLGNSSPIELINLVKLIECNLGKKAKIQFYSTQAGDVDITCADISKAKRILNFKPTTKIEDGIKKYIEWCNKINKL